MKRILICLSMAISSLSFAQNEEETVQSNHRNEISFQIDNLSIFNSSKSDNLFLTYRVFNNDNYWKIGAGGSLNLKNEDVDPSSKNDYLDLNSGSVKLNFGKGKESHLKNRFYLRKELNLIGKYSFSKSLRTRSFGNNYSVNRSDLSIGLSPTLGLMYRISPRVFLSTDLGIKLNYTVSKEREEYVDEALSVNNSEFRSNDIGINFYNSSIINLHIRF